MVEPELLEVLPGKELDTVYAAHRRAGYGVVSIAEKPSTVAIAYLAGILDGEGCFQISTKTNSFGLQVSMTTPKVPLWLRAHFGGHISSAGRTVVGRPLHKWLLQRHADLRYVLRLVLPYVVLKRAETKAMLALVEHIMTVPQWDRPTSRSSRPVRAERREHMRKWRQKREALRLEIQRARKAEYDYSSSCHSVSKSSSVIT